jgi:catechol 2,3-dioxygenase-like lactoylglutathione lyase family enzyme
MAGTGDIEILSFRPNLFVRDLAASIAFYRDLIGMEVQHRERTFALLRSTGGAELAVMLYPASKEIQRSGAYLYVRGVEALHQRFLDDGAHLQRTLRLQPWGLLDFVVSDPDGHAIGIGEWRSEEA